MDASVAFLLTLLPLCQLRKDSLLTIWCLTQASAAPQIPAAALGGQMYPPAPGMNGVTPPPQQVQQVPATLGTRPAPGVIPGAVNPNVDGTQGRHSATGRRSAAIANADASLESVERAMGEVRLASTNARTRRNGQRSNANAHAEITVPTTDFDFAGMNARFDKSALNPTRNNGTEDDDEATNPSEEEGEVKAKPKSPNSTNEPSYNPKSSFFDSLSTSASGPPPPAVRGGRGRGRGGMGKSRREEEREKNVATFGEPGGVGFMGPHAYVGGYGRRGGMRGGRRGGGGGPRRNVAVVGTEA